MLTSLLLPYTAMCSIDTVNVVKISKSDSLYGNGQTGGLITLYIDRITHRTYLPGE